jgi:hypothetical protein
MRRTTRATSGRQEYSVAPSTTVPVYHRPHGYPIYLERQADDYPKRDELSGHLDNLQDDKHHLCTAPIIAHLVMFQVPMRLREHGPCDPSPALGAQVPRARAPAEVRNLLD